MSQFDDIDIFAGPERDMMGVPITGSSRDRQLDALEGMARQRYIDPVENRAKDMVKMQVAEALSSVPGIKGEAISSIIALADSQNPDDKLMFNQIVSRLDLPVDVRRMGDDYAVSKRFEDVLGDNSSVGVSAYLPDEGDDQYSLSAEKRFPNFLGGEARVGGNISTGGDPEIRASFMRRFAGGGDVDIFDDPNRDPYYEELGLSFDNERGQYFEVIEHPEHGFMRSYVSPRDQSPVPELSGARIDSDMQGLAALDPRGHKRKAELFSRLSTGAVSDQEFEIFAPDMFRLDGSIKSDQGYLGPVTNKNDGKTMTELSIGVQIDGREVEIPAMVPTLSESEIEMLRNIRVGIDPIPRSIQQKAVEHARPLLEAGNSPFFKGYANGGDVDIFDRTASMMNPLGPVPSMDRPMLSPAQLANIAGGFAPGAGAVEMSGGAPEYPDYDITTGEMITGPRSPSMAEDFDSGEYLSGALKGLGGIGDLASVIPAAGPLIAGALKTPRAIQKVLTLSERLKRAKDAGFDTDNVYYHATDRLEGDMLELEGEEFTTLNPSTRGKLGPGVYMSPKPEYVERYIRTSYQSGEKIPQFDENARILPIFVRGKIATRDIFDEAVDNAVGLLKKEFKEIDSALKNNEFDDLMADRQRFALQKQKAQEILAKDGFSGFKVGDEVVVFDPKNIRSVNAEFEDLDSPQLLKARGGAVNVDDIDIFDNVESYGIGGGVKAVGKAGKTPDPEQGIASLPIDEDAVAGSDLQFLMNIYPGALKAQQDMGAFPMPSLAIVRQDQPFENFGDITLVGDPTSFDPKRLKANVVFNADAYTVRAPSPFRIAKKGADLKFKKRFQSVADEFQEGRVSDLTYEMGQMEKKTRVSAQSFSDIERFFKDDLIADIVFLREKGVTDIPITEGSGGNIFLRREALRDLIKPYSDERKAWGRKELDEFFQEKEFFDASVNRDYYTGKGLRLKPYTAEEVLKFMKKHRGSAQEGGMSTPGALRASLTEKLSSLKDIRAESGKLVGSDEFKNFQEASYERFYDLAESLKPFYKFDSSGFGFSGEVLEMLIESQKKGINRSLSEFGFENLPDYALQEIQELKSYFRNAPTEYFEAKPERMVDLEEFEGAIVPEDTPADVLQAFEDAGIKTETYTNDAERLAARKKFGNTAFSLAGGITLFGLSQESEAGGLSSFSKMNKLVKEESIKQAKEAGFDTDNVYYHGADADIKEFRMPSRETGQTKTVGTGVFMSSSPEVAGSYSRGENAVLYPVYINKAKFLKIRPTSKGQFWSDISTDGLVVEFPDGTTKPATEVFDLEDSFTTTDELSQMARAQGHKGLIVQDVIDAGIGSAGEYRYTEKYLKDKGYDVSFPMGTTKESFDKIQAIPSEVMSEARMYAKEKLYRPSDVVVSFDPKNIRSVNAYFDPKKKDSPNILATGLLATGLAAMGSSQKARADTLAAQGATHEMVLDALSGGVAPVAGGIAGLAEYTRSVPERLRGGDEAGENIAARVKAMREGVAEGLNYEPTSEMGRSMSKSAQEGLASFLQPAIEYAEPEVKRLIDYIQSEEQRNSPLGGLYRGGQYLYEDIFGEAEREGAKSAIDAAI